MMEFLVLADIHDTWVHLSKILRYAGEMDGVLFLGDLMTFRKFSPQSIDYLKKQVIGWSQYLVTDHSQKCEDLLMNSE